MSSFRTLAAAFAAVTLIQSTGAWDIKLPPCIEEFRPFVPAGCFEDTNALVYRSSLDTKTMTQEKCMAECKGNGYRYAGIEYYGRCACGATVNGPKVEDSKCNLPCNGNKTEICGGNNHFTVFQDPTFLPHEEVEIDDYVPLGCYSDNSREGKALSWRMPLEAATLTTEKCLDACKNSGYPFAGTEFGGECYCGVVIGNFSVPTTGCDKPCKGNTAQICGGSSKLSLYVAKELQSLEPCGHGSNPPGSSSSSTSRSSTVSTSSTASSEPPVPTTTTSSTQPPVPTTSSSSSQPPVPSSSTSSSQPPVPTTTTSSTRPPVTTPSTTVPTTRPPVTTSMTTTSKTSSSALCTSTIVIPSKCEYGCGKWCSDDLPDWDDDDSCKDSHSHCKLQISSCFLGAGWPDASKCFEFSAWCKDLKDYCDKKDKRTFGLIKNKKCKVDWFKNKPPKGGKPPVTTTTVVPCVPTTRPPVPEPTNICKEVPNPIGGIEMPIVTCNDLEGEWKNGFIFKLFKLKSSLLCPKYKKPQIDDACEDACKEQYDQCKAVYVEGCKENDKVESIKDKVGGIIKKIFGGWWKRDEKVQSGNSYFAVSARNNGAEVEKRTIGKIIDFLGWKDKSKDADNKCKDQYNQCVRINKKIDTSKVCKKFGHGW